MAGRGPAGAAGARRPLWALGVVCLMSCASGPSTVELAPRVESLTNGPELVAARLEAGADRWRLLVDLRFMNDCLADAGAVAGYLDLPAASPTGAGSRLIAARQVPVADGCPDIYRPVERELAVEMAAAAGIGELLLMDYVGAGGARLPEDLQLGVFDPGAAPAAGLPPSGRQPLALEPLFGGRELLAVSGFTVSAAPGPRPGASEYRAELEAWFADRCRAERGAEAWILESRTARSDRSGAAIVEWLFLVGPEPGSCGEADGPPVGVHHTLAAERRSDYARKLVLVNPTREGPEGATAPFTVADLWPASGRR